MVQCLHELSPCFSPMFVCCSGNLVVHLLQDGRGGISKFEVISCPHPFQEEEFKLLRAGGRHWTSCDSQWQSSEPRSVYIGCFCSLCGEGLYSKQVQHS